MSSFLDSIKQKSANTDQYLGGNIRQDAHTETLTCPNCGGVRDTHSALTHCPYCNHAFMTTTLTDGIHIHSSDNHKK